MSVNHHQPMYLNPVLLSSLSRIEVMFVVFLYGPSMIIKYCVYCSLYVVHLIWDFLLQNLTLW